MADNNVSKVADRMTRFERGIVFRVARGYFLVMAVVAVLLFLGGLALGARSAVKHDIPPPAPAPPAPARQPLTYGAVAAELQQAEQRQAIGAAVPYQAKPGDKAGAEPSDPELDAASKELRAAFPDPPYSWQNEMEKTCTLPTSFGCLQWGNKIKRAGVVAVLSEALKDVPQDEFVSYVRVLARVLKEAPVEKRLQIAPGVIAAERRGREQHTQQLARHQAKVNETQAKYKADVELNDAQFRRWRELAIYGVSAGFSLLIVVSLFLAFLSMERQTRALDQLTSLLRGRHLERLASNPDQDSGLVTNGTDVKERNAIQP